MWMRFPGQILEVKSRGLVNFCFMTQVQHLKAGVLPDTSSSSFREPLGRPHAIHNMTPGPELLVGTV